MTKMVFVKKDELESMKETLEIMSDKQLLQDIQAGIEDIRNGKTISLKKYLSK